MRITLLTGANKNAGDFLIAQRSRELLLSRFPDCEIIEFNRNKTMVPHLDEINSCDVVVFGGGPGYKTHMYPGQFPLVDDLSDIRPPLFAMGMGAYSRNPHVETYRCDDTSRQLLDRLLSNGFGFGCRDLFSERVLHSWGYADTVLTGCPAWYDLQFVESTDFVTPPPSTPQHIVVSDPADIYNKEYARHLIVLLRNMFPQARISFVFHAGWEADEFTNDLKARLCCELRDWLRDQGIQTQNAAYSTEGFSIYDTCDVHIGFRVHAHLYALSQRRPSILIEEDGRGFGANEALGIPHVPIWPETLFHDYVQKVLKRFCGRPPVLSTHQIESFLGAIQTRIAEELDSGYASAQRAFEAMAATYLSMREHIGRLEACSGARAS